jgi:hypothetical protein
MDLSKLFEPFPPDRVSWRVGSTNKDKTKGMALAYIDARDVMDRLDNACGPGGWQNTYPHANGKTVCSIGIKVDGEWVWKSNGAGDTDVEAEKGALSDAFKRAAVQWGVGRYLYDLASPWVEIEPFGRSYKIKDSEQAKLERLLSRAPQGIPGGVPRPPEPHPYFTPILRKIEAASDAISLGQLMSNSHVVTALEEMSASERHQVKTAEANQLASFERIAA